MFQRLQILSILDLLQDVARLLMLGGALTQMPAWYVELSYAQALEACALLAKQTPTQAIAAFQEGACLLSHAQKKERKRSLRRLTS